MDTKWYVIRTLTGKEKKAKEQLEAEFKNRGFSEHISQVLIPMEKIAMNRKGKKYIMEKNHYPGYILIECDPNVVGELKQINKNVSFVTGFLGDDKPTALRKNEVNRILNKMDELESDSPLNKETFEIGDSIMVTDGPFNEFTAIVSNVNNEKSTLKANVKIFGRPTPVELQFNQVSKVY